MQAYPNDFDGVLAGAAAQYWTHLNGQTYRINALVNPVSSAGHLSPADYAAIGAVVFSQCDALDGLRDGIITNPRRCSPDLSSLSCATRGANQSSCLSEAKLGTMHKIWDAWTSEKGQWLFPGFEVGSEASPSFSVSGVPFGPAPDFFQYQVRSSAAPPFAYALTFERRSSTRRRSEPFLRTRRSSNVSSRLRMRRIQGRRTPSTPTFDPSLSEASSSRTSVSPMGSFLLEARFGASHSLTRCLAFADLASQVL